MSQLPECIAPSTCLDALTSAQVAVLAIDELLSNYSYAPLDVCGEDLRICQNYVSDFPLEASAAMIWMRSDLDPTKFRRTRRTMTMDRKPPLANHAFAHIADFYRFRAFNVLDGTPSFANALRSQEAWKTYRWYGWAARPLAGFLGDPDLLRRVTK